MAFQAPDQLGGQVHLQRVALQVAGRPGDQVARGVDLLQGRDVLQNRRRLAEQCPRARVVEVRAVLRRPEAVGIGLGVGLDDRAHGQLPDVECGRIAGRHRDAAVALEAVALARRQAVIDLGALRGQVGRDEGELAGDQAHLHLPPVRVADDLPQERNGDAVGVLFRLDIAELRRAQPFVVVAVGADTQVGAGAGGGVHAAAPGARVLADRQVPGLGCGGELALHPLVGEPDPGRPHAPRELQDVHLQLGELVDQVPVFIQAHVPGVAVPDVHATVLPRGVDRHIQLREGEGGLALGDDVVRELKHDAQPLQQLVRGVHGARGIFASRDDRRAAVDRQRLQQVAAFGLQHREVDRALIGQPLHRGVGIGAAHQDQAGRAVLGVRGQLGVGDDRQPPPAQPLQVRLHLLRHEAVKLVGIRAHDHRRARNAVLEQSVPHD